MDVVVIFLKEMIVRKEWEEKEVGIFPVFNINYRTLKSYF